MKHSLFVLCCFVLWISVQALPEGIPKELRNAVKRQTVSTAASCFTNCSSFISYKPGQPHEVAIGTYINDFAGLNVEESYVRLDAYLWLKWKRCTIDQSGNPFRPDLSISIENAIQRVDLTVKPLFDVPDCTATPGYVYQIWRIEGQFHQQLNFIKYPLDRHTLIIEIEDGVYARDYLKYIKDDLVRDQYPASGISGSAVLSGWTINNFWEKETDSQYHTSWGAVNNFFSANSYSNYKFGVWISRGASVYILKVLPPIIITLLIAGFAFLMDIDAMDMRIGTAVTGLLTLVFLQLSFSDKLPASLDYLTIMDWVFNLGYVMCVSVVVECIVIRKIYYRLILQSETLKDDIQLSTLVTTLAKSTSRLEEMHLDTTRDTPEAVAEKAKNLKRRKHKIKRRIRHLEKILFVIYILFGSTVLFLISMIGNFTPDNRY